jgi:flagellar hook-associated protein 1 FlgK
VVRLSDNKKTRSTRTRRPAPQTIDGIDFAGQRQRRCRRQLPGAPDHQRRRRFQAGADRRRRSPPAAPIATSVPLTNKGTGKISEGSVDKPTWLRR